MPNSNYAFNELKGLSRSKIIDLLEDNGFSVWRSIEPYPRGPDANPNDPQNPCNYLHNGIGWASEWEEVAAWEGYVLEAVADEVYQEARYIQTTPTYACTGNIPDSVADIPVGMTGAVYTDGSNMVIVAYHPGSDEISYSKSWYHAVDSSAGHKIGETIVKGILGFFTGGLSQILITAGNAAVPITKPISPVTPDIPDEYRDAFQPVDSVVAVVDPSKGPVVQNPVDDSPETTSVNTELKKGNGSLLFILAAGAAALFAG